MESIAQFQYPQIVWCEGEKMLWNPIHRKALKNRPEERVRLRIIEYLIAAGWSKHRISTEEALKNYSRDTLRTDIICYSQDFDPKVLVECKAEHISLSEKTAEQVARYNRDVQAPYLLITNGVQDFWYNISLKDRKVHSLEDIPDILNAEANTEYNFEYWTKRGFAGTSAEPELRKWINPFLKAYNHNKQSIRYLQFKKNPSDLNLNNYYHISKSDEIPDSQIALCFLGTSFGGSRIIGILNSEGENKAVAEINLDLIFEDENPNTSIYSADGIQNIDLRKKLEKVSTNKELIELIESTFKSWK
ncbi:MAG: type I restriction enzyme HsdR N-terminal domain-containing protein [Balneolaceae bacterium]|nr:type I restriction enzyme HsdR N-terminal domain-containing protein [Balneolaceae bacterium]